MADSRAPRVYSVRVRDSAHQNEIDDILGALERQHSNRYGHPVLSFRHALKLAALDLLADDAVEYYAIEPDPTGRAARVARFLRDDFEADMARAAEKIVFAGHAVEPPVERVG